MAADNNLPQDIIAQEILIRLPLKSVVRYRCVCKLWNSLSYNPDFVSLFNQNPNRILHDDDDDDYIICMNDYVDTIDRTPRHGLSILSRNDFSETRIDNVLPVFPSYYRYIHLIGSINGLVCMATYGYDEYNHQFILWNPTIRFAKNIVIPKHLGLNYADELVYGFGWDSVTNDYKLIIAKTAGRVSSPAARVYSCQTDCWSYNYDKANSVYLSSEPAPCVIVNGSPFWKNNLFRSNNAVKFDIRNNQFTNIRIPYEISKYYSLINHNDVLALIESKLDYDTDVYCIDEEGFWTKMYTIDSSVNTCTKPVLCFKYGGELVFDTKRQLYDPKSHTSKHRPHGSCTKCLVKSRNIIKCRDCGGSVVNGFSYTPSLALPGMKLGIVSQTS